MAKWKELGEVPDSDDESTWDSQESLPDSQVLALPSPTAVPAATKDTDITGTTTDYETQSIWDVPGSSHVSVERENVAPNPGSRKPAPSISTPVSSSDEPRDELLPPLSSLFDLGHFKSGAKTSQVQSEQEHPTLASEADIATDVANDLCQAQRGPVAQETVQQTGQNDLKKGAALEIGNVANQNSRPVRSLRPRKPIQEHPYLLESVQYSKALKSHGLRPLRVEIEEEAKKRREEDSQEQDFEDDSQATSRDLAEENTDESQAAGQFEAPIQDYEFPLSDDGGPSPSPRFPARLEVGMKSSQDGEGEDEFPDPNDVEKWRLKKTTHQGNKRGASPKISSRRKIPRKGGSTRAVITTPILPDEVDIFDIPASPPQTSPGALATTPMSVVNRLGGKNGAPFAVLTPKPSSIISSRTHSPAPARHHSELIDLTALADEDSDDLTDEADTNVASESEPDTIREAARRMRGVLPASWLRLDQQALAQKKAKTTIRSRSVELSPERSVRKGVAQRRIISPRLGSSSALFLEDSDDSDSTVRPLDVAISHRDTTPAFGDDAVSVIEEDQIDRMYIGSKRKSAILGERQRKRKRGQQSTFKGQPGQRKRQQRISNLLGDAKSTPNSQNRRLNLSEHVMPSGGPRKREAGNGKNKPAKPPRLGILDVVELNAPDFLRIAARTASKRQDRGRSSPSKKAIMLGTRQDTIDAAQVLKKWNEGMMKPRSSIRKSARPRSRGIEVEVAQTRTQDHTFKMPKPLEDQSGHPKRWSNRFSQPRRMVMQTSMKDFIDVEPRGQTSPSFDAGDISADIFQSRDSTFRPAQLETVGNTTTRHEFNARKKALDALYRQSRRVLPVPRAIRLEESIGRQTPVHTPRLTAEDPQPSESDGRAGPTRIETRTKPRKQARPRPVDISGPQYAHANDPLSCEFNHPVMALDLPRAEAAGKLLGLGPYGSHYTQHFEIFPLDHGVFFCQNTLIGSGRLKRALESKGMGDLSSYRGRCTFTLDEQTLHWGLWDEQTSSQVGIVFDWVLDQLDTSSSAASVAADVEAATAAQAVDFMLAYLQDHLSFNGTENYNLFANRLVYILQSFERRLKESMSNSSHTARSSIETLARVLVLIVQVLRLCQNFNEVSAAFQVEEILKRLAAVIFGLLLRKDLDDIRDIYGCLQQASFREKGIKNDHYSVICWVTLIRIFEELRLPRASFWDVISPVVLGPAADDTLDASILERAWHCLFILLPLGEFDNAGVAISGMRHSAPLEGWTIPQRLLRRVFSLYQTNSRQSPSFNNYCRALVSRCHYLVEQWGWRKCNAILGTIFDFFAAQDLHNLRNEEIFQSPQFLEDLSESPSLATSPEDRCFHIFLKLIAMSVKRLRKLGLTNEAKNLVARLLPNHNRQYNKVVATHETEIAALRNHHDLLCTLFWAAPPETRPSIQAIEGLVNLGSSHKEACLISLRAWSRLSRFVVASCIDISEYKPFAEWQRNIFQQVLEQFLSVEIEINRQLLGMSVEASKNISEEYKQAVIRGNKRVATELLHFSMKAFLGVMRHTTTLSGVSFVLNNYPLEQIFTRLSFSSVKSDWDILQVALAILDYYLTRINDFSSSEPLRTQESWHEEDAIMLLERKFASPFISTVRDLVNVEPQNASIAQKRDYDLCIEQAVTLAGGIAACLIRARLAQPRRFFRAGTYQLFPGLEKPTASSSRKYVALFLVTMIKTGVSDFKDLGLTSLDLFLAEITKPFVYLGYENRLAMGLKLLGEAHLENATIEVGNTPDYSSNRDLFNYSIVSMRKALLRADVGQKSHLQSAFSKALRLVMERMKVDLKLMVLNSPEHLRFVEFVRSIIVLIRSQDICPVDSFFYQISQEYSPSRQDPRLQTAGIFSWGLKLEEGDSRAGSGLFYLLFPNFKIALANGELGNEADILKRSMEHVCVLNFMLGTMLPAIIKTSSRVPQAWVLLETYVEAVRGRLSSSAIPRYMDGNEMINILALHTGVLASAASLQVCPSSQFQHEDIVCLTSMIRLLNILSPSARAYTTNEPESSIARGINEAIEEVTDFTRAADTYLSNAVERCDQEPIRMVDRSRLFGGLGIPMVETALPSSEQIERFSSHMIHDIRNNWLSNETVITVKGPARQQKSPGTQSGQGTPLPKWNTHGLLRGLWEEIRTWNHSNDMMTRTAPHNALFDEVFF